MKMKVLLTLILFIVVTACTAEPETIVQTVVVESTVEVPVTVEVTTQVEVTRQVEVTVETVREVEVTREVALEVTRLVETVVTATPIPTEEVAAQSPAAQSPAATAAPANAASQSEAPAPAPVGGVAASLLQSTQAAAENVGQITDHLNHACRTGMSSGLGKLNCGELVRLSDAVVNAPTYNVSGSAQAVQEAYGQYRWAIDTFAASETLLLVGECRTSHAGEAETEISSTTGCSLGSQQREPRNALNTAVNTLQSFLES